MPSRVEVHSNRHEVSNNYSQQKVVSHTLMPRQTHDVPIRSRHKRMRFTSGGTLEDTVSTSEDCNAHRQRRHVNPNATRFSKGHVKHSSSHPSSPTSPCSMVDCVHSRSTVVIDTTINGVEHIEDDNSFSSSVFSEHLVQPELQMVIAATPDDTVEQVKSRRSSILSTDNLLLTESDNKEADVVLAKEIKGMENLLIHADSGISTPTIQAADDAGSSEGEDENDGKDEALMHATDAINLNDARPSDNDLPSVSGPSLSVEHHGSAEGGFSEDGLALLKNSSFSRMLPVQEKCDFVREASSSTVHSCLLPDPALKNSTSPVNTASHFEGSNANSNLLQVPQVMAGTVTSVGTRVRTRSQTAERSKQHPYQPLSFSGSRRDSLYPSKATTSSPVQTERPLIVLPRFKARPVKSAENRRSTPRGRSSVECGHSPGDDADLWQTQSNSREVTPSSTLSPVISASSLSDPSGVMASKLNADESVILSGSSPVVSVRRIDKRRVGAQESVSGTGSNSSISTSTTKTCEPRMGASDTLINLHESGTISSTDKMKDPSVSGHVYPLRSRLRRESMRRQLHALQAAPKALDQLPTEVMFRITHYLSIQDVFRLQLINRRLKAIVERYLLLVKRINFSNGLPFAFLPESINDVSLKRILSRTPEVTHILGFYPRHIAGSYPSDCHSLGSTRVSSSTSLTYAGIVSAFRICPKLRSVELMDVELMGKLVHYLPRIKFHGMFRNRPDSWDCEYAVPLPSEGGRPPGSISRLNSATQTDSAVNAVRYADDSSHPLASNRQTPGCHASAFFCSLTAASAAISATSKCKPYELLSAADIKRLANKCLSTTRSPTQPHNSFVHSTSPSKASSTTQSSLPLAASVFAHKCAVKLAALASWFEPAGEFPLGQGSPSTVPHFLPTRSVPFSNNNNVIPWYDHINFQPGQANPNVAGPLDAFRNLAIAPHNIQPGLPPIEAELIAAAPIGREGIPNNAADGGPVALNNHGPVMALAFGAVFISPHLFGQGMAAAPVLLAPQPAAAMDGLVLANQNPVNHNLPADPIAHGRNVVGAVPQPIHRRPDDRQPDDVVGQPGAPQRPPQQQPHFVPRPAQPAPPVRQFARSFYSNQVPLNAQGPWLVSPLPNHSSWIGLPHTITNLTKLDLASVSISAIPRLDNIKYLHLKWVVFASTDPFVNFSATKLQSFVMNNCSGPSRVFRFVRIFSALARAPQLMRLELVGTRFVDGLLGHIIDDALLPGRSFRNLQRLVLSSNRDSTETDVGLLLLAGQASLNHVALQIAHTKNSLFEALAHASAKFPRLENLILGYQDPYQSRLTVSELMSIGIGESSDHLLPICGITDWGVSLVFQISPRLTSLTLRHAPYLSSMQDWKPQPPTPEDPNTDEASQQRPPRPPQQPQGQNAAEEDLAADEATNENTTGTVVDPQMPLLRSLTLENCPGLRIETLEHALSTGEPFPCLETLVMRDMFMSRFQTESGLFEDRTWIEQHQEQSSKTLPPDIHMTRLHLDDVDWCKASHLLALSDLLNAHHLGFSSMCPEGIGLASSVREVGHLSQPHGLRLADLPVRPFDLFYSVRTHHYLNSVLELDGSCGPLAVGQKRIASAFFSKSRGTPRPTNTRRRVTTAHFVSQSTQTCICGLLELQFMWHQSGRCEWSHQPDSSDRPSEAINRRTSVCNAAQTNSSSSVTSNQPNINLNPASASLGGPLAFHPFPVSNQHQDLNRVITASEWTRFVSHGTTFAVLSNLQQPFVSVDPGDCPGCASNTSDTGVSAEPISASRDECSLTHRPRKWIARDACIDTTELRCHIGPGPLVFTVFQPDAAPFSNLTSIHFEKVGISHLVLSGAPHLKNITLENCPHLEAILFTSRTDAPNAVDVVPALRRIRVLRCPKFAIYYLLHAVASLYPAHDENISITYRPFGHYDEQVERALWNRAHHAHVLISHDYKQQESERGMEEFHSSFDQLFREVINFADMLVRRELLVICPKPNTSLPTRPAFRRSEHGAGWNLVTDIPWIHEVCCSTLRAGDSHRSDQADQFYEVLSEIQTARSNVKIQRRGIHLHIQYRDVHAADESRCPSDLSLASQSRPFGSRAFNKSYLKWDYDELYLASTTPDSDINAWGDGLDENLIAALPPCAHLPNHTAHAPLSHHKLPPAVCLLLAQEEAEPVLLDRADVTAQNVRLVNELPEVVATDVDSASEINSLGRGFRKRSRTGLTCARLDELVPSPQNVKRARMDRRLTVLPRPIDQSRTLPASRKRHSVDSDIAQCGLSGAKRIRPNATRLPCSIRSPPTSS